ncbi:MAG TPA: enoyl-CoA hydratase-related protein [Burkholderiales bacterium]|nr:enoyl-CoA hydratase-related protein [Burkholderiales bacterium]
MVELSLKDGVARVFLNRVEKANALDWELLTALMQSFQTIKEEKALRVVVLGGQGKTFCAGADLSAMSALTHETSRQFITLIHEVCAAIRALPVPVVARLQGSVIGAGLEIAAACDLRIAAEGTRFLMPEVRLGIPSVVEAALLPRLMGSGRAAWLVLTGEAIDAARAYEWGFVEEVTSSQNLDARVDSVVKSLLAGDPEALRVQKELLQKWDEAPLSESIAASIEHFAQAFAKGNPVDRLRKR